MADALASLRQICSNHGRLCGSDGFQAGRCWQDDEDGERHGVRHLRRFRPFVCGILAAEQRSASLLARSGGLGASARESRQVRSAVELPSAPASLEHSLMAIRSSLHETVQFGQVFQSNGKTSTSVCVCWIAVEWLLRLPVCRWLVLTPRHTRAASPRDCAYCTAMSARPASKCANLTESSCMP